MLNPLQKVSTKEGYNQRQTKNLKEKNVSKQR